MFVQGKNTLEFGKSKFHMMGEGNLERVNSTPGWNLVLQTRKIKKSRKKLLTSFERCANINKLSARQRNKTKNLDNKTVYSNPENS